MTHFSRRAIILVASVLASSPAAAQRKATAPAVADSTAIVPCYRQQDSLYAVPEIRSDKGKLKATLKLVDGYRVISSSISDPTCAKQHLRYLAGYGPDKTPWPATNEPIPGPTFRARLGDQVQIAFFNQINTSNFVGSLDKGTAGTMGACDQYTTATSTTSSATGSTRNDSMPNCLHGSSTTNVHFHGTHTTPATTGDNVLLFVRPAYRDTITQQLRARDEARAVAAFRTVFANCEKSGAPTAWSQMPSMWQSEQKLLLQEYDRTAAYNGVRGGLPASQRLWPYDSAQIRNGDWPQYHIGAGAYCFPLPKYGSGVKMGQSPGTMWYHAHKHGSTALNVANGLTGAFIIAGEYDDTLKAFYPGLKEQVMMIQQIGSAPFPLTNPSSTRGPNSAGSLGRPPLSVNGRRNPVVNMNPGEIQMWRMINAAFRDAVFLNYFEPQKDSASQRCKADTNSTSAMAAAGIRWRQIAQDGVQFDSANYRTIGRENARLNLGPANRADLLVKAPSAPGMYTLCVSANNALLVDGGPTGAGFPDAPRVLLTVKVRGTTMDQQFIPQNRFPVQPKFLADITDAEVKNHQRTLTFGAGNSTIDGKEFKDHTVNQVMLLNTAEEWTIKSEATDKAHPFHIHINPFQINAIFEPNSARYSVTDPSSACYVNPLDPNTWKPCAAAQFKGPFVWWDVFPIPTARSVDITKSCPTTGGAAPTPANCPAPVQAYTTCTTGTGAACTVTIPGFFRMRTRFVDFTGQYVLHCHILVHEDRGMMQLIEVRSDKTGYSHH